MGMSTDPHFGAVLMFGLGGIWVEVFKDVSFRIVPLMKPDAADMIREIKGYPLLTGVRGQPPADVPGLEKLLLKVSKFIDEKANIIHEMDLNPVFVYESGNLVADARIILENTARDA